MNPTEAQQLRQEIVRLKQEIALRPIRVPTRGGGSPIATYLGIIGVGNIAATVGTTNYYGLKYPAANVTTVPTIIPPTGLGACPDGLTIGQIEQPDLTYKTVWIGCRLQPAGVGPVFNDLPISSIPRNTLVLCRTIVTMPCTAGGTVPVYVAFRLL